MTLKNNSGSERGGDEWMPAGVGPSLPLTLFYSLLVLAAAFVLSCLPPLLPDAEIDLRRWFVQKGSHDRE